MELRRRSTASAKKARKEDAAPHIAASKQSDLLPELLHLISDRLSSEDIAYASLSCKSWALHLRTGMFCISKIEITAIFALWLPCWTADSCLAAVFSTDAPHAVHATTQQSGLNQPN